MITEETKAVISFGYTRSDLAHYQNITRKGLVGADIEVRDGLGKVIAVHVREGQHGYRIVLNGRTIEVKP